MAVRPPNPSKAPLRRPPNGPHSHHRSGPWSLSGPPDRSRPDPAPHPGPAPSAPGPRIRRKPHETRRTPAFRGARSTPSKRHGHPWHGECFVYPRRQEGVQGRESLADLWPVAVITPGVGRWSLRRVKIKSRAPPAVLRTYPPHRGCCPIQDGITYRPGPRGGLAFGQISFSQPVLAVPSGRDGHFSLKGPDPDPATPGAVRPSFPDVTRDARSRTGSRSARPASARAGPTRKTPPPPAGSSNSGTPRTTGRARWNSIRGHCAG